MSWMMRRSATKPLQSAVGDPCSFPRRSLEAAVSHSAALIRVHTYLYCVSDRLSGWPEPERLPAA